MSNKVRVSVSITSKNIGRILKERGRAGATESKVVNAALDFYFHTQENPKYETGMKDQDYEKRGK